MSWIRRLLACVLCLLALCAAPGLAEQTAPPASAPPAPSPTPVPAERILLRTESGETWVFIGQTLAILHTVEPAEAPQQVDWSVSDEAVAVIDDQGVLSALAVGKVAVRACAHENKEIFAEMEIEVRPVLVESIRLSPARKTLMSGGRWPVKVAVSPENATDPTVLWRSSDPKSAWIEADETGGAFVVSADDATGRTVELYAYARDESGVEALFEVTITPPVSDILVGLKDGAQPVTRINRGENLVLGAQVLPSDASDEITWHSSDDAVAAIAVSDGAATVTGVGGGDVTLSACAQDGSETVGQYQLFVRVPIESVALSESAQVFEDRQITLAAALLPEDTTDRVLRWYSADPSVATVDAQGTVRGVSVGSTRIMARSAADMSIMGECLVNVTRPVSTILLDAPYAVLGVGGTMRVNATVSPLDAGERGLTWRSSNPEIAAVDANGLVTALTKGSTMIQALAIDGSEAVGVCSLEVRDQLESITLPAQMSVTPGESFRLVPSMVPHGMNPGNITWKSENEEIALVTGDGLVTGISLGQTTVSVTTQGGLTAQCQVTVSSILSGIEIYTPSGIVAGGQTLQINLGETLQLLASARPAGAKVDISYKSANPKVAYISSQGLISARRTGRTAITVTAQLQEGGGRALSRTVNARIIQPVTAVTLLPEELKVLKGYTAQLEAVLAPDNATYRDLTWAALDAQVATVSDRGVVTGTGVGSTLVTAISHNRLVARSRVTVAEPAAQARIQLAAENPPRFNPGDEIQLICQVTPDYACQQVIWKSSNTRIATVDSQGKVLAKKAGSARITATVADGSGVKDTMKLAIVPAVKSLKLNKTSLTLFTNGSGGKLPRSARVKAKISPSAAGGRQVVWSSSDERVAAVDEKGNVSAVGDGMAVITATTENSRSDTLVVQVFTLPSYVDLGEQQLTLAAGESADLTKGLIHDGSDNTLQWKSSRTSVARVDKNGVVTARKAGKATISVRTRNGLSARCAVQVISPQQATPPPVPAPSPAPSPEESPVPPVESPPPLPSPTPAPPPEESLNQPGTAQPDTAQGGTAQSDMTQGDQAP